MPRDARPFQICHHPGIRATPLLAGRFSVQKLLQKTECMSKTQQLLKEYRMSISAKSVRLTMTACGSNYRVGAHWASHSRGSPRLTHTDPEHRQKCELPVNGSHWDELDEDISVTGS